MMKILKSVLIVTLIAGFVVAIQPATTEAQDGQIDGGTLACSTYASNVSGTYYAFPGSAFGSDGPFESAIFSFTVTGAGGATGTVRLVTSGAGTQTLAGPSSLPATFTYLMPAPGSQPPGLGIYVDSISGGEVAAIQISVTCGYAGCMPDIPPQAVVGAFTQTAEIYWAPGKLATGEPPVEAGNTYWVAGQDETGMYRKVLIACQWVWVRAETVGPNYDEVWNGAPLPTDLVE
jgi:hypothetical protein